MKEILTRVHPFGEKETFRFQRLFIFTYLFVVFLLFLYSFTQVDLGLTLSRWFIWQIIQKAFQQIGYFNRLLSAGLYVAIVLLLFIFYFFFLFLVQRKKLSKKEIWFVVSAVTTILALSYNAFSYDLFNYIFDAKIITYYHQNPYIHKALDFPQDPMLSFMHWVHRVYPYGPVWIGLTVPLSYAGLRYFLATLILFKLFMAGSFIGIVYYIGKIAKKLFPQQELLGVTFFALNPLVIVESLVSAHNDIVMLFLAVAACYFLIEKKYTPSFLLLFLSIGIKFATAFLLPIFLLIIILESQNKKINWYFTFFLASLLMGIAIGISVNRTEMQPWYFLWILPFMAFIAQDIWVRVVTYITSLGFVFVYAPFLYIGVWSQSISSEKISILAGCLFFSFFITFFYRFIKLKS